MEQQYPRAESPLPRRDAMAQRTQTAVRTEAITGNLGWDLEPEVLAQRAELLLQLARSSADLTFHNGDQLQAARLKARALQHAFSVAPEKQRICFLAVKKTREELWPSHLACRAFDFGADMEWRKYGEKGIELRKDRRGKFLYRGNKGVGASIGGMWRVLLEDRAHRDEADLNLGLNWIGSAMSERASWQASQSG
jgi:hypothetical protein